jgi:lipopolysaccharide transport system ATP-binding protein
VDNLLLLPGRYRVDIKIFGDNQLQDHVEAATVFDVAEGAVAGRPVVAEKRFSIMMPHRWTLPKG